MKREKFIETMKILDDEIEEKIQSIGIEDAVWDLAAECFMKRIYRECEETVALRMQCVCIYHTGECEFEGF